MSTDKHNERRISNLSLFRREQRKLFDQYRNDIENYDKEIQSVRGELNKLNLDLPESHEVYRKLNDKIDDIYTLKSIKEEEFIELKLIQKKNHEIEKLRSIHVIEFRDNNKDALLAFVYYFIGLYGSQEKLLPIPINDISFNTNRSKAYHTINSEFIYDLLLLIFLKKNKVVEAFIDFCGKEISNVENEVGIIYHKDNNTINYFSFLNIIDFAQNHFFEENAKNVKIFNVLQKALRRRSIPSYFDYEVIKNINQKLNELLAGINIQVMIDSLQNYSKWYFDEFLIDNRLNKPGNFRTKNNHPKYVLINLASSKKSQSVLTIGFNDYSLDQEIRNVFPNSKLTKALRLDDELISTLLDLIFERNSTNYKRLDFLNVQDDKFDHVFIDTTDNFYFNNINDVFENINSIIKHLNKKGKLYLKFGEDLFEERNKKFRNKLFNDNLVEGLIVLGGRTRTRTRNSRNIKGSSYQDEFLYRKFQPRGGHTFYESARPNAYMVLSKDINDKVYVVHEELLYQSNMANIANSDVVINNFTKLYRSKRKTIFSRYVDIQEIKKEEYSLNTSKYFEEQNTQDKVSLNSILQPSKPIKNKLSKIKNSDYVIHVLDDLDNLDNLKTINLRPINDLWKDLDKIRAHRAHFVVEGPTLLVSITAGKISSVYIGEKELKKFNATTIVVPQEFTAFKIKPDSKTLVDPYYLSHKLGSGISYREISRAFLGFTLQGFNLPNYDDKLNMQLLDLKIGLPDLAEQLRFVESLGTIAEEWNVKQDSYTKRINDLSNQNVANFLTLKHETGDNRAAIATNTRLLIDFFSSDKNKLILKELDKNFKVEDDDDSILESLNMIKKSITDLSNQLETKKYTTSLDNEILEENSINELEEMFGEFQKKYIKSFQIEFTIDYIQEDLIIAYAKYNYELLKKLFDNLLRNSRDHAFSNYGSKLKNLVSVIITVDAEEDSITICYRDNGKGFPDHFTRDDFITLGRSNTGVMGRGEGGANIHEIAKFHENENWQLNRHPNSNFSTEFIFNLKPTFYE